MIAIENFERSPLSVAIAASKNAYKAVTKRLKLQSISKGSDKRKLVISTNWLPKFGFKKGVKNVEESLGESQGFDIRLASEFDVKTKLTYERSYANRENETQTDTRNQSLLDFSLGHADEVLIIFKPGVIRVLPVFGNEYSLTGEPVQFKMEIPFKADELDTAIFNVLDYVEESKARKVTIEYDAQFENSDQKVLLDLQLKRMGYSVSDSQTSRRTMVASIMPESDDDDDMMIEPVLVKQLSFDQKHKDAVISNIDNKHLKTCFFAASAGVDISAMEKHGFTADTLLEWRPHENRDIKQQVCKETGEVVEKINDKSETGAICAFLNSKGLKYIFNEDMYKFDSSLVSSSIGEVDAQGVFHVSLQCDDFSNCKNESDTKKSLAKLDSTVDMFFPALKIIKERKFPMVICENVPQFSNSTSCKLFEAKLESMGYQVHKKVLDALDYNGYSSRRRMMLFATILDAPFTYPEKEERKVNLWDDIIVKNLHRFRDVSHTGGCKTYIRGQKISTLIKHGRLNKDCSGGFVDRIYPLVNEDTYKTDLKHKTRLVKRLATMLRKFQCANVVTPGATHCGTILKSQNRQVAESFMVKLGDEFLFPDNEICKMVMGVDPSFNIDKPFTKEIGMEIIGQSIEVPMHARFSEMVDQHIQDFLSGIKGVVDLIVEAIPERLETIEEMASELFTPQPQVNEEMQLSLF